ncbi:zinc finger [Plasmopara halstedii]|uniref:Zinc finger n=1 Tax=Plasmopara halstedii TaxID=4781 RepID=A0A0P1B8V7_PLAHL|nr:zinc finger [Plasmopara halstedii]CEG50410.1 zinc finger [Plasmopara halstedii]|eukprot:XP_024586779.1 zinc finger [Plasmopara halstedii]
MSITLKKHKCVERSLESDCPICHAYMFTSTTPVMFLPCGHCMHVSCYEEYTLTNYICPLCSKSLGDMELYFASIDELLERERMPMEYQDYKSLIYCSDCERKSTTNFHFVYHKCQYENCMSYNTKLLRQFIDSERQVSCGPTAQIQTL